jgi:hypothetical protein
MRLGDVQAELALARLGSTDAGDRREQLGGLPGASLVAQGQRHAVAAAAPAQFLGRPLRDDPPAVDDQHAVTERIGLLEVVRREEDGRAAIVAQAAHVLPHVRARLRIEPGGRLVEEQQAGLVDQAHRDVEPPPLTAGERLRPALPGIRQLELLEQRVGASRRDVGVDAVEQRLIDEFLADSGLGVGAPTLCDVTDAPTHLDRLGAQIVARDPSGARRRSQQRRQHAQRRRLAGAVRPEEPHDLTLGHVQVDARDSVDRAAPCAERAREPLCLDHPCLASSTLTKAL